jgi:hypothetical protein
MGDSYSSGEGLGCLAPGTDWQGVNMCHRAKGAWGMRTLPDWSGRWFVACSGATIQNLLGGQFNEPPQIDSVGSDDRKITLTIGGNDVGFSDVVVKCLAFRGTNTPSGSRIPGLSSGCDRKLDETQKAIAEMRSRLSDVYRAILLRSGRQTRLVVSTYPVIFPSSPPQFCRVARLATAGGFGYLADDVQRMATLQGELNQAVRDAVADVKAKDPRIALADVAAAHPNNTVSCGQSERPTPFVEGLRYAVGVADLVKCAAAWVAGNVCADVRDLAVARSSFHPNDAGHAAMARVAEEPLRARTPLTIVSSANLRQAAVGKSSTFELAAVGGQGKLTWKIIAGSAPAGMQLDSAEGDIWGTPRTAGFHTLTVQVTDSAGSRHNLSFQLIVRATSTAKGVLIQGPSGKYMYIDLRGWRHSVTADLVGCLGGTSAVVPVTTDAWDDALSRPEGEEASCFPAASGDIIKHPNGDSYVLTTIGATLTRRWLPDAGTYWCHSLLPRRVFTVSRYQILDIASGLDLPSLGCMVKGPGGDAHFVNGAGRRESVADTLTLECELRRGTRFHVVSQDFLNGLPQAGARFCYDSTAVKGKVVRGSNGKSWYIDKRGGKHSIPDGGTFECIAAQTGGAYTHTVPAAWLTQTKYEDAACVRANPGNIIRHANGDAYLVNSNWTRSWIPTASSFACFRAAGRALVNNVPRYYIDDMAASSNQAVYGNGNCIIRQPGSTSWYINNEGNREWIPDTPTWDCEIGRGTPVIDVSAAYAAGVTEKGWHYCLNTANLRNKIVRNISTGAAWLVSSGGTKTWIPDEFTYNCRVRQGYQVASTYWQQYIDAFGGTTWDNCFDLQTFKNKLVAHSDGDTYWVDEAGVRHWVPSSALGCMKARHGNPHVTPRRNYIDALVQGDWAVCGDSLLPNQNMDRGQWLRSSNGYTLVMQYDGNLVLYSPGGSALWASGARSAARKVRFDGNGALSIQDGSGNWLWSVCNSYNSGANSFVIQTDGNLVLYRGSTALWWRGRATC